MPFDIALSGIRAANSELRMTGNNIANASTTGFKESRTEFGDIYSTSVLGGGANQIGSGVRIQNVAQQFTQGNISFTDNILDLAVNGEGFFVMDSNGEQMFTRAGTFSLDNEGFIQNNVNARLQGYSVNPDGTINNVLGDIQIEANNILPQTTTLVESALNLDSREDVLRSSGTEYVSSGGVASFGENGYTAQSLTITNPDNNSVTVNSLANDDSFATANNLNSLAGITATAEASATISAWTSGLGVTINGASLLSTDLSAATAEEISGLPGLSATFNAATGTISVSSTIGDLEFGITGSGAAADEILTVSGATGASRTLEVDGLGNGVTVGNADVTGSFIAGASAFATDLATQGVGSNDYDFTITVDGLASAGTISLPALDYADHDAVAAALQTAINTDINISGVTVSYDTDHYVFTSPSSGSASSISITAVGGSANNLGIATGTSVVGTDDIVVGGIVTLQLDEDYTLMDGSATPIFVDPSTNFVNNAFDPADSSTYNHATSVNIYDSLGNSHVMEQFYIKQPDTALGIPNHWQVVIRVDGRDVGDPVITDPTTPTSAVFDVYFDANGAIDAAQTDDILISNWQPHNEDGTPILGALQPNNQFNGGTLPIPFPSTSSNFQIQLTGSTQVGSLFEVRSVDQDGTTTGRLAGLDINDEGVVFARYTNGENEALAQIVMASFPNTQGLQSLGETSWAQTSTSGAPAIGVPGTAALGLIQSGALEESNVDLSEQLVGLILAQRNFQASAKTIETADQVTQTIINLR